MLWENRGESYWRINQMKYEGAYSLKQKYEDKLYQCSVHFSFSLNKKDKENYKIFVNRNKLLGDYFEFITDCSDIAEGFIIHILKDGKRKY